MSWFADLAGKAENLLNNLDEQTGVALRNHNVVVKMCDKNDGTEFGVCHNSEGGRAQRKRPGPRSLKKAMPIPDNKSVYSPSQKSSPSRHPTRSPMSDNIDSSRNGSVKSKKSPTRRSIPHKQYNLDYCPKTLVGETKANEIFVDQYGLTHRMFSLPSDLEPLSGDEWTYKMQNMEVENAMLKNELNVMNREVAELLDRLRRTEDGNDVDSSEATKNRIKSEATEVLNHGLNLEKLSLNSQLELLKIKMEEHTLTEVKKYKEQNQIFEAEVTMLKSRNFELEERCKELTDSGKERDAVQTKLENDLRHGQSTISDLQSNLYKTTDECRRLEKDWESYKLRVKNMLQAKDKEIKKLQDGMHVNEDTKVLMEQMEHLKEERDELTEAVGNIRTQCDDMRVYLKQVEARHNASERIVVALRDALRDERAARNKADAQSVAFAKEIKAMQMETGQTIASLRTALQDKENELHHLRDTSSTVRTTDTSALNVADYDVMQDTIDNKKIEYLTQTLVQRQTKIDNLLAENNMLKIQMEKLETKIKSDMKLSRPNFSHSVVHLQEGDGRRTRSYPPTSISTLSLRIGVMVKRHPIIRVFVIFYMICLHFWVITVLFTSSPVDYVPPSNT